MPLAALDLVALRRWVITARADLSAYADTLNRLNVFPVPDGDTGSNLLMTMSEAIDELDQSAPTHVGQATEAMARATLHAARGNSGVILSQLARGVSEVVAAEDGAPIGGAHLAAVLARAADLAQQGVSTPVPGTILSVAAAAADGARAEVSAAGSDAADLCHVVDAAVRAAAEALLRTRSQNEVLRRAGVVDAGGAGYLLVIEALQRVVHGEGGLAAAAQEDPEWLRISSSRPVVTADRTPQDCVPPGDGPSYEVMFLLDQDDERVVRTLKERLDGLGDSLVVAGGPGTFSVHVHVDDVAGAVNAAVEAGSAHRFRISRFADRVTGAARTPTDFVVVAAVAEGQVSTAFVESGFAVCVDPGQLLAHLGREGTLVLCGSPAAYDAAESLREHGVVPVGKDTAQALAAAAVLPGVDGFEQQVATAREAAADVRSRRIEADPGPEELLAQVRSVVAEVGSPELLTLVTGPELDDERVDALTRAVAGEFPQLGTMVLRGGDGALTVGAE